MLHQKIIDINVYFYFNFTFLCNFQRTIKKLKPYGFGLSKLNRGNELKHSFVLGIRRFPFTKVIPFASTP